MAVTRGKTRKAKQGGVVTQAMTLIALASSAFMLKFYYKSMVIFFSSHNPPRKYK